MSDLNKKYQEILAELEKNVKDPSELNLIKSKLSELVIYFTDMISKSVEMENDISKMNRNIRRLQNRIEIIEDDIYIDPDEDFEGLEELGSDQMHDNDYEFEITCPYCDYEFITDNSYKNTSAIRCPKCNKIIELDWNIDDSCSGDCGSCESHCYYESDDDKSIESEEAVAEENEEYSIDVKPPKKKNNKKKDDTTKEDKEENDDDM